VFVARFVEQVMPVFVVEPTMLVVGHAFVVPTMLVVGHVVVVPTTLVVGCISAIFDSLPRLSDMILVALAIVPSVMLVELEIGPMLGHALVGLLVQFERPMWLEWLTQLGQLAQLIFVVRLGLVQPIVPIVLVVLPIGLVLVEYLVV